MKILLTIILLSTSIFASRIYLIETNEIIAFREDGQYHFIGKVKRLTHNPEKDEQHIMFTLVDQPRSFDKPFLVKKSDLLSIQLLTTSIAKTKVYFKSQETDKGLVLRAIQLIDPEFENQ